MHLIEFHVMNYGLITKRQQSNRQQSPVPTEHVIVYNQINDNISSVID